VPRCAGVERREDAGLAVGRPLLDVLKTRVAQHAHRQVAAFRHAAILCGDRRLTDPRLQALHGFVVTLLDLLVDRGPIRAAAALPAASIAPVASEVPTKVLRVTAIGVPSCSSIGGCCDGFYKTVQHAGRTVTHARWEYRYGEVSRSYPGHRQFLPEPRLRRLQPPAQRR
jgi:hypothetical protein